MIWDFSILYAFLLAQKKKKKKKQGGGETKTSSKRNTLVDQGFNRK
jgi:hypothetical protein